MPPELLQPLTLVLLLLDLCHLPLLTAVQILLPSAGFCLLLVLYRALSHLPLDSSSHEFMHLLTIIYCTNHWPEVAPLSSITAESCVSALLSTWVSRLGVPSVLTSDRGALFTSSIWTGVCSSLKISASTTTSFHPQSNGIMVFSQVCSAFSPGGF